RVGVHGHLLAGVGLEPDDASPTGATAHDAALMGLGGVFLETHLVTLRPGMCCRCALTRSSVAVAPGRCAHTPSRNTSARSRSRQRAARAERMQHPLC